MTGQPVALVTGAAGGIGQALAEGLHAAGHAVALVDRDANGLTALAARLDPALALPADLADVAALDGLVAATLARFGRLDLLINSAGLFQVLASEEVTQAAWDTVLAVNLRAPFFLTRAAARVMRPGGAVIHLSSVAGYYPRVDQAAYGASKAALEHLTRIQALELAPAGIRVNAIRPGLVATGMARAAYGADGLAAKAASIPLGKPASTADIVEAALHLARAGHVTGQVLTVDGGQTINVVRL